MDTLVNNAAVLYCDPFDNIPEEHRREILAVNLEAPSLLIAALAPQMKARRSGRVVNVSSVSAFTGHPDLWYGITKAGVINMTKSWAKALGSWGIQVNAVAPARPSPTCTSSFRSRARTTSCARSTVDGRAARMRLQRHSLAGHRSRRTM